MAVPDTGGMEINQENPFGARFDETILDPPGRRVGPGMLPGIFENIVPERSGCQRHRLARNDSSGTGECPSVIRAQLVSRIDDAESTGAEPDDRARELRMRGH